MRLLEHSAQPRQRRAPRQASEAYDAVLTTEGKVLLERRAEEIRTTTLPSLLRVISENPNEELARLAYEDGVAELRRIESVLARARPIPTHPTAGDQVRLGDRITVSFLPASDDDGEITEEFLLVHPFEAPLDQHRISVTSPLGGAVLGHRVGNVVTFDAPTQRRSVRILERVPAH